MGQCKQDHVNLRCFLPRFASKSTDTGISSRKCSSELVHQWHLMNAGVGLVQTMCAASWRCDQSRASSRECTTVLTKFSSGSAKIRNMISWESSNLAFSSHHFEENSITQCLTRMVFFSYAGIHSDLPNTVCGHYCRIKKPTSTQLASLGKC